MSKQGEMAIKGIERLISQRDAVRNAETWVDQLKRINQLYSPERNELLRVIALFEPHFDYSNRSTAAAVIKIAKSELRTIVRGMKKANNIK